MAEDIELLRLRAKAKLKLRQMQSQPAQDTAQAQPATAQPQEPQPEESWAARTAKALAPLSYAQSQAPAQAPKPYDATKRPSSFADMAGVAQDPMAGLAPALDAMSLPSRALATTRGMEMSDPGANVFNPEIAQTAQNAQARNEANPWNGRTPTSFADFGQNAFSAPGEMALAMGGDPLSFTPAIISKAAKVLPKVANVTGKGFEAVGESQMRRVVKPLMRHERKATKPIEQTIFEYGLDKGKGGASPKALYERSSQKLNQLGGQLKAQIRLGKDQGARINTDKVIAQAIEDFKATKGETPEFFSMAPDLEEVASDFRNRARQANVKGFGDLDLLQAQNFKQYLGHEGAWQHIAKAKGIPVNAKETARSQFAEDLYHRLNDAIDEASPEGLRDINRQLSEIIPVNQATGWRQVVEGRQNNISLTDVIGMSATAINPKVWPIMAVNRLSKSGTVASKIYRLGEKLRTAKTPAEELRYVKALEKIGLTPEEIEATKNITKGSGEDVFNRQELIVAPSREIPKPQGPANQIPVVTNTPTATPSTQTGGLEWKMAGIKRRQAEKYLQATLKREPNPQEVQDFLKANGDKEIPKPPEPEIQSREFKGRRTGREMEGMENLLRNGDPEWPTTQTPINKAPESFTIGGMELKRTKSKWDNQVAYKDQQGKTYTFRGDETIHMDAPKPQSAAPAPEATQVKDDFIGEDGQPLFQTAEDAGIPEGRANDPKVIEAAAKAWKEKGTESPFFKRWFKDSKVVGKDGKPQVLFHGTAESGLKKNKFDKNYLGSVTKSESAKHGFFFVSDKNVARGYSRFANEKPVADLIAQSERAERQGKWAEANRLMAKAEKLETTSKPSENIVEAYVSVKKPYEFDADNQRFLDIQDEIHEAIAEAKAGGHDGIVFRNLIDNADWGRDDAADHWMLFDPKQIKSATGNRGTFNPKDPSILNQSDKLFSPKGQIVRRDGKSTITLYKGKADASTALHEHSHWLRSNTLNADESNRALKAIGKKEWTRDAEEDFAKGFEKYLFRGEAPTGNLKQSFDTMKKSMRKIYINGEMEDLPEGLKEVYDAVFIRNQKISKRAESILFKISTSNKGQKVALMSALKKELGTKKQGAKP